MRLTQLRLKLITLGLVTAVTAAVLLLPHPSTENLQLAISHVWAISIGHCLSDVKGATDDS